MIGAAWQALVSGPLRAAPGRTLLAALAIAAGIALGVAVHLINASAAAEFRRAALQLAGAADLVVRGPRAGFDESLYPHIATLHGIALASPVLELTASRSGSDDSLKVVGLDALRAWQLPFACLLPPPAHCARPPLTGWISRSVRPRYACASAAYSRTGPTGSSSASWTLRLHSGALTVSAD